MLDNCLRNRAIIANKYTSVCCQKKSTCPLTSLFTLKLLPSCRINCPLQVWKSSHDDFSTTPASLSSQKNVWPSWRFHKSMKKKNDHELNFLLKLWNRNTEFSHYLGKWLKCRLFFLRQQHKKFKTDKPGHLKADCCWGRSRGWETLVWTTTAGSITHFMMPRLGCHVCKIACIKNKVWNWQLMETHLYLNYVGKA